MLVPIGVGELFRLHCAPHRRIALAFGLMRFALMLGEPLCDDGVRPVELGGYGELGVGSLGRIDLLLQLSLRLG
jgi:hypothetical protein